MPKYGERDPVKERYWRRKIAEFESSGLTRVDYLRLNDIAKTKFVYWQRTIRKIDLEKGSGIAKLSPGAMGLRWL